MTYTGRRLCCCGCRRPAVDVLLHYDLAFATACRWKLDAAVVYFYERELVEL